MKHLEALWEVALKQQLCSLSLSLSYYVFVIRPNHLQALDIVVWKSWLFVKSRKLQVSPYRSLTQFLKQLEAFWEVALKEQLCSLSLSLSYYVFIIHPNHLQAVDIVVWKSWLFMKSRKLRKSWLFVKSSKLQVSPYHSLT